MCAVVMSSFREVAHRIKSLTEGMTEGMTDRRQTKCDDKRSPEGELKTELMMKGLLKINYHHSYLITYFISSSVTV